MVNFELLSQGFNGFVNEVCTLITHKDIQASKYGYQIIKDESCSCSCTTVFNFSFFFPSGKIVCSSVLEALHNFSIFFFKQEIAFFVASFTSIL
jgi:hypothetical protein